jgi:hypothetical protein
MILLNGAWLPSITVGLTIFVVIVLLLLGTSVILAILRRGKDDFDREPFTMLLWACRVIALIITVIATVGYYPYAADYHKLQPATGVVKSVDSRFLAASQYVVVTFADTNQVVRCDDSRCSTLKPGDTVTLLCTKEHQFGSPLQTDGWGCRWGQ